MDKLKITINSLTEPITLGPMSLGIKGVKGDKGDAPVRGTDYWTETDKEEIITATIDGLFLPLPEHPDIKFLNGKKEWADIVVGGASYAANLYFTTIDSDISGYKKISYLGESSSTTLEALIPMGETLLRTYLFDLPLGITSIDAGLWTFVYSAKVSKNQGTTLLRAEIFTFSISGEEVVLYSESGYEINNSDFTFIRINSHQPQFSVGETDRLGVRIYANTDHPAGITISTLIGGPHGSYFNTPLALRHNQLRDLNSGLDYQHITNIEKNLINTALQPPIYVTALEDTTLLLENNHFYKIGGVTTLNIVDNEESYDSHLELRMASAGEVSVSLSEDIFYKGENIAEATNNELWEISITNGRALTLNWGNI